ncbi:MAG: formylglycine-generating enzyme family protein [Candidatus Aminicenantes bacterium]|nr:MAG: formylglycine-generating enzyme family protein [Candidatus Aminicenantes bacterium]
MVLVPAGEFIRGSEKFENAKPVQSIYLDAYMIGKYTVTNQEFKRFVDSEGYYKEEYWEVDGWRWRKDEDITEPFYWYDSQWNGPNFPVVGISWFEANAYANWLAKVTGKPFRLPTEAEWEKAACGTDGREYPWGNKFFENLCNTDESGLGRTMPVGLFPAAQSPYCCMDMVGNILEWCADYYDSEYYKKSPLKNPKGPEFCSNRVLRGGGWANGPVTCTSNIRLYLPPATRLSTMGFRLAMSL